MFDFILGKKIEVLDLDNINLLEDKYHNMFINTPFDIVTLDKYFNSLRDNNLTSITTTIKSYTYTRVTYWISDSDGLVYDYKPLLVSILENIIYFKDNGCNRLKALVSNIEELFRKLNLPTKVIRVF